MRYSFSALVGLALAGLALSSASPSYAEDFPDRPIRLVVGFAAGGPTDVAARIVAQGLSEELGQQVIVENRAGANANIAATNVAQSDADGYTLLYATSSIVISQFMYENLLYDLRRDFTPIGLAVTIPHVLVVPASSPYKTAEELIAALKSDQRLVFASAGVGNANHLSPLLFLYSVGASADHVPYRGSAPALNDLVAGRVDFMADAVSTELPFIQSGMLRPLGVAGKEPLEALPGVPPLAVSLAPGYEVGAWSGVLARKGTPEPILAKLRDALGKALQRESVKEQFARQSVTILNQDAAAFDRFLVDEQARLGGVIKSANIKPE